MEEIHLFERSGLGKAPFRYVPPSKRGVDWRWDAQIYVCEHCGTMLSKPHTIISSDNKMSIVGIDCLNKVGDAGLVDAAKQELKRQLAEARMNELKARSDAAQAAERKANNGKTLAELRTEQLERREALKQKLTSEMIDFTGTNLVFRMLDSSMFGKAMVLHAISLTPFTKGQLSAIIKIRAKHISGARAGSKKYLEHVPIATAQVQELQDKLLSYSSQLEKLNPLF